MWLLERIPFLPAEFRACEFLEVIFVSDQIELVFLVKC